MKHLPFPGAWYADALPTGEYAVLFDGRRMATHLGPLTLPPGDQPLYHRITAVGGFRIAGQAHRATDTTTFEWANGQWHPLPVNARGVSPCIYDRAGRLHISDGSIGSQGWRYVAPDGRLVTGDETYPARHGLSEWTDLSPAQDGSLLIGQGHDHNDALLLWDGSTLRQVDARPSRFIRAYLDGERVSLAAWQPGFGASVYFISLDELRAMPPLAAPVPVPVPQPTPEPPPMTMFLPADVHAAFVACVEKFPHAGSDDDRRAAMRKAVETIRARHGVRWVWKTEHATEYASAAKDALGYVPESEGAIVHNARMRMFIWDMIDGGSRQPNDAHASEPLRTAIVLAPEPHDWLAGAVPVPPAPVPTPTPPPAPTGCACATDLAALRQELAFVVGQLRDVLVTLPANIAEQVGSIVDEKLAEMPAPEPSTSHPNYTGTVDLWSKRAWLEPTWEKKSK